MTTDEPRSEEHPLYLTANCPECNTKTGIYNTSTPQGQQPAIICHRCGTRTVGEYVFGEGFSRIVTGMLFPTDEENR